MTREKQILALTCLLVVLPILVSAECPSVEDTRPCTCYPYSSDTQITCNEIDNEKLATVASRLRGRKIDYLTIKGSTLGSIPHDVFKGIKLRRLEILNSTLSALTDGSEAFVGLEDQLERLVIKDCVYKNKWDWSVLRNLKKLDDLRIWKSIHLETIGDDTMKSSLSSVKIFTFGSNNISFVYDHAFDSFKDIQLLAIYFNKIKNVKRTMLPNPAWKLEALMLRDNEIEEFPVDMFTNMDNLKVLDISNNNILVLDDKTFLPVWKESLIFLSSGNPLRCNCRMSWIAENRTPEYFYGECASPPGLNGTKLKELKPEHFLMCH